MLVTIALSYWVISNELAARRHDYKYQSTGSLSAPPSYDPNRGGNWVKIFSYYCLLIHFLVFVFPLRSCWAVFTITRSLRKAARTRALRDIKFGHRRRGSSTSLSSSETLTSSRDISSTSSSEAGDLDPESSADADIAPDRILHAIVIPNYKEENDTLRETLEVLASHPQARNTYDVSCFPSRIPAVPTCQLSFPLGSALNPWLKVATGGETIFRGTSFPVSAWLHNFQKLTSLIQVYLAMEQREHNADTKAARFANEFAKKFRSIDFTIHPADIPGELAGKGSNMAWAARKLSEKYNLGQRKDVIVTGIDGGSHFPPSWSQDARQDSLTNLVRCSRQPPVVQLLLPGDDHAYDLPRYGYHDAVLGPHHLRPQRPQCPCYRPRR